MADTLEFRYMVVVKLKTTGGGEATDDDAYLEEEVRGALEDAGSGTVYDDDDAETGYDMEVDVQLIVADGPGAS